MPPCSGSAPAYVSCPFSPGTSGRWCPPGERRDCVSRLELSPGSQPGQPRYATLTPPSPRAGALKIQESDMDTTTLLIIVLIILLVGGGGYYGRGRWY